MSARRICTTELDSTGAPAAPAYCSSAALFRRANAETPFVWAAVRKLAVGTCRTFNLGAGGLTEVCAVPGGRRR